MHVAVSLQTADLVPKIKEHVYNIKKKYKKKQYLQTLPIILEFGE